MCVLYNYAIISLQQLHVHVYMYIIIVAFIREHTVSHEANKITQKTKQGCACVLYIYE